MSDQEVVLKASENAEGKLPEGDISAEVVNLSQSMANTVKAELVRINQGGAEKVIATEVELKQGGVNRIEAQQVVLSQGGVGFVQAASFNIKDGGAGLVRAETIEMTNAGAAIIYGQTVGMKEESFAGLVFARRIEAEKINTKVLLAGNVEGQVETVMDTRQALLSGLAGGFVVGILLLIGQLFSRRK